MPWPLVGRYIFNIPLQPLIGPLTKLDRKQVLNTLYQVCDFQVDLSTKMAALVSNLPIFDFPLNRIGQNLTGNKYSTY